MFLVQQDNDRIFYLPNSTYIGGEDVDAMTLREIKKRLEVIDLSHNDIKHGRRDVTQSLIGLLVFWSQSNFE